MRSHVPPPLPSHAQQGSVAAYVRALPPRSRPAEVWRSAAHVLLRLNPKECEALGQVFEDEQAADDVRVLVLDLLAGAGSNEAQVVMRRLLALAVARRNARVFATFVQRLGFVDRPDGPTLRFLMSVYAESKNEAPDVCAACAYALGAAAGQAFQSGDAASAARACDVLRRDLRAAGTPQEKAALLAAVGNGGLPGDAGAILRFVSDAEPTVRAAAAVALRKISTAETRSELVSLLADTELRVAESALVALQDHRLVDDELERLAELVLGGRTALALDARLLHLVVAQRTRITPAPGRAGALENALRLLLGRAEANVAKAASGEHVRPFVAPSATGPQRPFPGPSRSPSWTREHPAPAAAPAPSGTHAVPSRAQLEQLGLDPNASISMLPPPPKKKAADDLFATVVSTEEQIAEALAEARTRTASPRQPSPYAIVRGKAVGQ